MQLGRATLPTLSLVLACAPQTPAYEETGAVVSGGGTGGAPGGTAGGTALENPGWTGSGIVRPDPRLPTVVIGAGVSGLAAAADLQGEVILLEADPLVGGRANVAGGFMFLVGTEEQAAFGLEGTVDDALADWA